MDRAPRIAVVGAGLMGRWHAHAIRRSGLRVAAVVDPDMNRAKSVAGNAIAATNLDDVLNRDADHGGMDAVHICTPIETHFDLVQAALNAGAHVLVEKPVTDTLSQTTELFDHAAQKGLYICPVHQFPFQRGVAKAAGHLKKLGSVREIAFTIVRTKYQKGIFC